MRVEEREREARIDGLHPQADLAQLHGHRIEIDAEDAAADDLPERVPVLFGRGRAVCLEARDVRRKPARRGEEKVSRTARGIDDR